MDACHTVQVPVARRIAVIGVTATVALGLGAGLSGCGEDDGLPSYTTKAGVAVFTPADSSIEMTAGPQFIVELPAPARGASWQLVSTPDDMGGVSLKGMSRATGTGRWTFDTIGAGSGTLEFQQIPSGGQEPTETTTFEVNVT
jgi:hypothetical protein